MTTPNLFPRAILLPRSKRNSTDHTCPVEDTTGPPIVNLVGNLTYHQLSIIISGACTILSILIISVLVTLHAKNYSNPVQQRQIIRIVWLVPWVSLFSLLIVWREDAGEYLAPSLDFGCSIALSSFLLFMCDLVLGERGGFEELFGAKKEGESPVSLRRMWYGVLQFIPTSIVLWIATAASLALGTYCKQSNSFHFAHIYILVIEIISTTIAILNSIRFYGAHKKMLQKHRIMLKLFAFKGIIGLNGLQTFILGILSGQHVLKPNQYMTFHDLNIGLPSFILSIEMPIFAILMFVAFPVSPYSSQGPAATSLSSIVDALNITDLLSAFVRGPMRLVRDQQRQILRQNSMRVDLDNTELQGYESRAPMGRHEATKLGSVV